MCVCIAFCMAVVWVVGECCMGMGWDGLEFVVACRILWGSDDKRGQGGRFFFGLDWESPDMDWVCRCLNHILLLLSLGGIPVEEKGWEVEFEEGMVYFYGVLGWSLKDRGSVGLEI